MTWQLKTSINFRSLNIFCEHNGYNKYHNKISTNVLWIRNWRTLLHMRRADAACALTRRQHFSVRNYVMATNQYLSTWTILPDFTPIRFEMKWRHLRLFLKSVTPTRTRTTRWVALWDQFLIKQKTKKTLVIECYNMFHDLTYNNYIYAITMLKLKSIHDDDRDDDNTHYCGR